MNDLIHIVEPMIPALRRYARAMMRDRDQADDLVQDCLERVISHWRQRRASGEVRPWVFAILHNLAINALRRTARRGVHVAVEDAADPTLLHAPAQEDGLHLQDLLAQVAALPEEQRGVLLLVSVEGMSYAETASVLGVPVGTVMSRLSRARDSLVRASERAEAGQAGPYLRRVK